MPHALTGKMRSTTLQQVKRRTSVCVEGEYLASLVSAVIAPAPAVTLVVVTAVALATEAAARVVLVSAIASASSATRPTCAASTSTKARPVVIFRALSIVVTGIITTSSVEAGVSSAIRTL